MSAMFFLNVFHVVLTGSRVDVSFDFNNLAKKYVCQSYTKISRPFQSTCASMTVNLMVPLVTVSCYISVISWWQDWSDYQTNILE